MDRILKGLIPGDNLVWQVDRLEDYRFFVTPCARGAIELGRPLVYFRFARHEPLVGEGAGVEICTLEPKKGFEEFTSQIHRVIERTGRGTYAIFDCVSSLAEDWYSDQMLSNWFMLTCPYLYDMEAIAYFGILRHTHSAHTTSAIAETAQIWTDVYRRGGKLYVHPWKVQARFSPTMHMVHAWEEDGTFRPISESATISEVLTSTPWVREETSGWRTGIWNRAFQEAQEVTRSIEAGHSAPEQAEAHFKRLLRMAFTRDPQVLRLAEKYLTLADVLRIGRRIVGTGLIGGKSVGMLLARAILKKSDPRWQELLEPHDSFYIGSDVFYTFLVRNGLWWTRERQKDAESFLQEAELARQRMVLGTFPDYVYRQFEDLLDYFGQSPIIVRSSSLMEDNFGNAFAGKYESVFCANQGPRKKRLEDFLSAVRTIYASAMSVKALTYRAQRGLLDRDEQMALLVQRVSGAMYGESLYYPQLAGVGFSLNPYVWSDQIDPAAGMLRLVFGLGTRAVDRTDDDYTRLVALNAPERRPEANFDEVRQYSQRKVDVLDLEANQLVSMSLGSVVKRSPGQDFATFASRDERVESQARQPASQGACPWVLTFEKIFAHTPLVADLREALATLQEAYEYPVDIEFAANFFGGDRLKVNILQCRPLQIKGGGAILDPPADLADEDVIVRAAGAVVGQSRRCGIGRAIYVVPEVYGELPVGDRHTVARVIGRLTHLKDKNAPRDVLLMGPGRWGTSSPSLGVPVRFSDISGAAILCEIVAMRDDLVPDVSLGTHFFSELVEMDILYFAVFPGRQQNRLNLAPLDALPNRLADLMPDYSQWSHAIRVVDAGDMPADRALRINANALTQKVVCYLGPEEK